MNKLAPEAAPLPVEILAFQVSGRLYGIDSGSVREIRSCESFARSAGGPLPVKGTVSLNGLRVSIIDLRVLFANTAPRQDESTAVVIVNRGGRVVGLVVDDVADVFPLSPAQVRHDSRNDGRPAADCVIGVAAIGGRRIHLLALEKLMKEIPAVA